MVKVWQRLKNQHFHDFLKKFGGGPPTGYHWFLVAFATDKYFTETRLTEIKLLRWWTQQILKALLESHVLITFVCKIKFYFFALKHIFSLQKQPKMMSLIKKSEKHLRLLKISRIHHLRNIISKSFVPAIFYSVAKVTKSHWKFGSWMKKMRWASAPQRRLSEHVGFITLATLFPKALFQWNIFLLQK